MHEGVAGRGIAEAAVDAGLTVAGFASQARFLMNAGITDLMMSLDPSDARAFLPQANAVQKLLSASTGGVDLCVILRSFARPECLEEQKYIVAWMYKKSIPFLSLCAWTMHASPATSRSTAVG